MMFPALTYITSKHRKVDDEPDAIEFLFQGFVINAILLIFKKYKQRLTLFHPNGKTARQGGRAKTV
jgi:hypothetical protein